MAKNDPTSLTNAIKFALHILEPFRDSSLYDDYQDEDGWTDDQFEDAMQVLYAASAQSELARQHYFIVNAAEPAAGAQ